MGPLSDLGAETHPALVGIIPEHPDQPNAVHIGIDVGQVHDPTAVAVAQVVQRKTGRVHTVAQSDVQYMRDRYLEWAGSEYVEPETETVYLLRRLRRLPLNTPYPDVERRIADIVCSPTLGRRARRVLIDRTGVGRAVAEHLEQAIWARQQDLDQRVDVSIQPITFTSGRDYDPKTGMMGKPYLVSRLMVLISADPSRIIVPVNEQSAEEAAAMREELRTYSIKVSQDGHDTYGAMKIGQYDDLATALGLSVLEDPNDYQARSIPFIGYPYSPW